MNRPLKPGTLMAYTGIDPEIIKRIVRVVEDSGTGLVLVQSDEQIEGEAAIEHDFPTPDPVKMRVEVNRLRPIIEKKGKGHGY